MKVKHIILSFLLLLFFTVSCSTVPITGRKQLSIIPASQIISMSFVQYDQFLRENKLSTNKKEVSMIKRVGANIKNAVERYFAKKNMSDHLKGYNWEFNLVENEQMNAWCMPGGKVVFYTGILPVCKNETGVAVVMGHEIAHAVAEHGSERMSQGLLLQFGGMGLQMALENKPQKTQQLWLTAFGIGSQLGVMLPFSRLHESEADYLGMVFMAMAGYNPEEAVEFWKRMSKKKKGASPPEFLSTHPADETRINDLKKLLPKALEYYKK